MQPNEELLRLSKLDRGWSDSLWVVLCCRVVLCHGSEPTCMQLKSCLGFYSWIGVAVINFGLCCVVVSCCGEVPRGCIILHATEELLRASNWNGILSDLLWVV